MRPIPEKRQRYDQDLNVALAAGASFVALRAVIPQVVEFAEGVSLSIDTHHHGGLTVALPKPRLAEANTPSADNPSALGFEYLGVAVLGFAIFGFGRSELRKITQKRRLRRLEKQEAMIEKFVTELDEKFSTTYEGDDR